MAKTTKSISTIDNQQALKLVYNEDASLATSGFLVGGVGRKITQTLSTTSISNDTETFAFIESGITLYEIEVIYTDGTREVMISAERTA